MPLPKINIVFKKFADTAIRRSERGVVAVILRDAGAQGGITLLSAADVPEKLTDANRTYLARTFLGYVTTPRRVLCYVLAADGEMQEAFAWLSTQVFDYLVLPPDAGADDCAAAKAWVLEQRAQHRLFKAVLPDCAADHYAIINLATPESRVLGTTFTAAQMASRIAGIICGTPMTISCTYAPLPELTDCTRLSTQDADRAVDAGKLILLHDGRKVKIARGVTSMTTVPDGKSEIYKKIKLVDLIDMIEGDIRTALQDTYIGKYPNTYDNKMVVVTAILDYLRLLERDGLLRQGSSTVDVDTDAQRAYLAAAGEDVAELSEQDIRGANTGSQVFLRASISPIDAIEEISLVVAI